MLFLLLGLLDLRWVESGLMTSVVFPPLSPSTETGLSPRFWIPPPRAPVWCSPPFTCATSNTNMMAFYLWVRLWLWARGSGSPHLFLTCSGGGGGPAPSLSPLLHGSFTCFSGWMRGLPFRCWGYSLFYCILLCDFNFLHFLFFIFIILMRVPA